MKATNFRDETLKNVLNLAEENSVIFLNMATGSGKSKLALAIAESLITEEPIMYSNGEMSRDLQVIYPKILVIIAERAHQRNWWDEFNKHNYGMLLQNTTFTCYASLHKFRNTGWDIIIVDESHHLSELRLGHLSTLRFNKAVFLSATMKKAVKACIEYTFRDKKTCTYKVSLDDAITADILPEPKIFIHKLTLNNTYRDLTIETGNKKSNKTIECKYPERWAYIKMYSKTAKIIIKCTEQEKYNYLTDQVDYLKRRFMADPSNIFAKNKWLRTALDRKIFLGKLKTDYAKVIINKEKDKRLICFCTDIEQANLLGGKDNIVHSKIKDVEKVIINFQLKSINRLYCVNMLTEGMNLNSLDVGIIVQLDSEELKIIQKLGRLLRSDSPKVHITVYLNTRDSEYLDKVLETIDNKYIKFIE